MTKKIEKVENVEVSAEVETMKIKKVELPGKPKAKENPSNMVKKFMNEVVAEVLEAYGVEYFDGKNDGYGMTEHTIIARLEASDVQIKFITPARKYKGRYTPVDIEEE